MSATMKCVMLCLCISFVMTVVLSQLTGDQGPMLRPQRPSEFQREGEVKEYLKKLRQWVEDSMRNNARFGKRQYSMPYETNQNEEPKWKTDYNYYTRYNQM